jgi:hypothetical protein
VKPTYGLTDEQVEQMILDSFEYAEADIEARQVIEARNEAETVLHATAKGLQDEQYAELSAEEKAEIEAATANLREATKLEDHQAIRSAIERLSNATMHLAELIMNAAIAKALKDKRQAPGRRSAYRPFHGPSQVGHGARGVCGRSEELQRKEAGGDPDGLARGVYGSAGMKTVFRMADGGWRM